jgi:hypothetical protein
MVLKRVFTRKIIIMSYSMNSQWDGGRAKLIFIIWKRNIGQFQAPAGLLQSNFLSVSCDQMWVSEPVW